MGKRFALVALTAICVAGCTAPPQAADQSTPSSGQSYSQSHGYQVTGSRLGRTKEEASAGSSDIQQGSADGMLRNQAPH